MGGSSWSRLHVPAHRLPTAILLDVCARRPDMGHWESCRIIKVYSVSASPETLGAPMGDRHKPGWTGEIHSTSAPCTSKGDFSDCKHSKRLAFTIQDDTVLPSGWNYKTGPDRRISKRRWLRRLFHTSSLGPDTGRQTQR